MARGDGNLPPAMSMMSGMINSAAEKYVPMMSDEYLTSMLTHIRDEIDSWINGKQENNVS